MFYVVCHFRFKKQPLKVWRPCCAIWTLTLRGSLPASCCKAVMTRCWTLCTEHTHHVVGQRCGEEGSGGRRRAGQSGSVYLLFSALTACDWLALLNWALNTHIAALKLHDGWEGINSSCRLQELLQSNGTITRYSSPALGVKWTI